MPGQTVSLLTRFCASDAAISVQGECDHGQCSKINWCLTRARSIRVRLLSSSISPCRKLAEADWSEPATTLAAEPLGKKGGPPRKKEALLPPCALADATQARSQGLSRPRNHTGSKIYAHRLDGHQRPAMEHVRDGNIAWVHGHLENVYNGVLRLTARP